MTDMNLAMVLSLKDKMVGPLRQAVEQVEREFVDLERQAKRTGTATGAVADGITKVGRTAGNAKAVATELRKVGDEAARASRELGKMEQAGSRMRSLMSGTAKGVAGMVAFNHVVADPLRKAADYDTELRRLANTTYAGQSLDVRRAGMGSMNAAITGAVRSGGGSRDQALIALNELVSSGAFGSPEQAISMLPSVMKSATASGADAKDLAIIAIRAKQSMGINTPEGLADVMDRALAAGNAGGFELKDMAKWLPSQMASAQKLGMSGVSGISALLAANQGAVITAGTKDEAGNNLVDLLGKITAQETAKDFANQGIDLTGSLVAARGNGMNALDGFIGLVDKLVAADPKFAKLQAAAGVATGDDKKALLASQVDLMQGSVVGKVIQDRQALMALVALMNNRDYLKGVSGKIEGSKGAVNDAAALITEGAGFAFDQRNFEREKAQTDAMTTANSAVMKLAEAQTNLYQKYPGFASAVEGATVAVTGLAAAAGAVGLAGLLTGGRLAATTAAAGSMAAIAGGSAAAAAGLGMPASAVVLSGVAASALAANTVAANPEAFKGVSDNEMLSAMSGDAGIAAAIMAVAERPVEVKVSLDGHQLEAAVTKQTDSKARRGQ